MMGRQLRTRSARAIGLAVIMGSSMGWAQVKPAPSTQSGPTEAADREPAAASKRTARTSAKSKANRSAKEAVAPVERASGWVIRQINVEGQRKLEKDAILNRLKLRKGQAFSEEEVREDVLSLFKLGYFNDIQVDRKVDGANVDLTYKVLEKPSLAEIVYEGNSEVKTEDLVEASGLKQYEILNMSKVRDAVEKLQKLYEDKGFFLARIESQVTEIKPDETSKVTFKIVEGDKVKVKKILFVGNKKLSDETLKDRMYTKEEGYFTAVSGSGAYKQEAFERDVQVVRFTYLNNGYIKVKVDRPQISVTPDKKGIYLTIRVEEGEQYNVGEVDFAGDLLFPRQELFDTIKIDKNGVFAYDVLQRDLSEIQAKYGDLGYAYVNVIPRWEFREAEKKVNLVFEIDKGNKVYFGRFDVTGNSKTRDKVLRREMKIRETELYNETRRRESLENIQRLGFFEEVNFKTSTPPDHLDVMNVEIVVKERNTGQVQVSAGYGSSTGLTFGGSVQQTNFAGRGQNLGVSMSLSHDQSVYDLSFTEPYFNDTLWSLGGRVFRSSNTGRLDYNEDRTGASVQLGHPVSEHVRAYLSYGYTASRLSEVYATDNTDPANPKSVLVTDPDLFPLHQAEGDASTIEASLAYDTRNDRFKPSKGMYARASAANTGLIGGNLRYYTVSGEIRYFRNLFWDVVWRNAFQYAHIGSVDNINPPPFNELYLLGGPYSLRGFRTARVGKMLLSNRTVSDLVSRGYTLDDATSRSYKFFGGQQKVQLQSELQFPLVNEASMFGVVFYDVGEAEDAITNEKLYADWGFGLRWFSPIGPLRFEWGFPLNRDPIYHDPMNFEFSIGTPF